MIISRYSAEARSRPYSERSSGYALTPNAYTRSMKPDRSSMQNQDCRGFHGPFWKYFQKALCEKIVEKRTILCLPAALRTASNGPGGLFPQTQLNEMPGTGLEPAHPCEYQHLKLARLPIPPPRQMDAYSELS